ncbi:MAG: MoxR family ATPase [Candidatus Competibacteraceae bacterium]|nr:MoxR family ATPase [Candidatus Competibacteraceae bacterium]
MTGSQIAQHIARNIERVMQSQAAAIRLLIAACASGGHVLLEDVPGTGKTTLAKAFARSLDLQFQRIQFTPDLLPSDILGVSIFDQQSRQFHLHKGPIFTDILLADEINRASPRTQSALLEAMAERQVTLEREIHPLREFFLVVATQNPIEFHGTYPLPEAQMDRFALRFSLGYVAPEQEVAILAQQALSHPLDALQSCATTEDIHSLRQAAQQVRVSDELKRYIVDIVAATRQAEGVQLGAGPRASIALMKTAQALALFDDIEFVTPEHIQELTIPCIAHRLALDPQARFAGQTADDVVREIVKTVPVPI